MVPEGIAMFFMLNEYTKREGLKLTDRDNMIIALRWTEHFLLVH